MISSLRALLLRLERHGQISSLFVAFVSALIAASVSYYTSKQTERPVTIETRIHKLTSSLQDASFAISDIEKEVQAREALLDNLKKNADEAQRLKDLNSVQVEAVAQALKGQLEDERKAHFWQDTLLGAAIGAFLAEILHFIVVRCASPDISQG